MKSIVIIHFQPLENYPPITNIINELNKSKTEIRIRILTNHILKKKDVFSINRSHKITISRLSKPHPSKHKIIRGWNYLKFYVKACTILLKEKPIKIIYFETLSALPALVYHTINRATVIGAHFHEYSSPKDYQKGMWIEKFTHKLERLKFPQYEWISHTNQFRLNLFLEDNQNINPKTIRTMPNYPPNSWIGYNRTYIKKPVKVIYIGALCKDQMYLEEFCKWVVGLNGAITFDIYSNNYKASAINFLQDLNNPLIKYKGETNYYNLPTLLSNYSVGVILYKGVSKNYIFNAPNKLFEYYSCGLDTWFPENIIGSLPYVTKTTYPRILALDFNKLDKIEIDHLICRKNSTYRPSVFTAEESIKNLKNFLLNY